MPMPRVNIKKILKDPIQRRELMVQALIAIQAREGITTTKEQATRAYDNVQDYLSGRSKSWQS